MTVTSNPTELRREAARQSALNNHAYAAALYQEAVDNVPVPRRGTQQTTDSASVVTEVAASHVQQVEGHDGTNLSG